MEELVRKNAEIEAKNKKIEESNTVVARTFTAGNAALEAKNYDEAIKQYDEGIAADPEQPALLTQKSAALKARGVERYNAAITSKDEAAKGPGLEAAKSDFRACGRGYQASRRHCSTRKQYRRIRKNRLGSTQTRLPRLARGLKPCVCS